MRVSGRCANQSAPTGIGGCQPLLKLLPCRREVTQAKQAAKRALAWLGFKASLRSSSLPLQRNRVVNRRTLATLYVLRGRDDNEDMGLQKWAYEEELIQRKGHRRWLERLHLAATATDSLQTFAIGRHL